MTASRFAPPYQYASSSTGTPIPGALLNFYVTRTSTRAETYADASLTTANENPVPANAAGIFPDIFLDPSVIYTAVLTYPETVGLPQPIWTANDVTAALNVSSAASADTVTASDGKAGALWTTVQGFINYLSNSVNGSLVQFTTNTTIEIEQIDGWGEFAGSGITVTLPLLAKSQTRQSFLFLGSAYGGTIIPTGNNTIFDALGNGVTSLTISPGEVIQIASGGPTSAWYVVNDTIPQSASPASGFSNLKISTTGANNYVTSITADSIVLKNVNGAAYIAKAVNVSPQINVLGANGFDTGLPVASNWYYVFVIYNPVTATLAGLFSASSSAPTLPSGYTFYARIGAVLTLSNGYLAPVIQYGARARYVVTAGIIFQGNGVVGLPHLSSGASGDPVAPSWTALAVAPYIPPTACAISVSLGGAGASTGAIVAPSEAYGGYTSLVNVPPLVWSNGGSAQNAAIPGDIPLESGNIYWASGGSYTLSCTGWEDNL